ncbi:hypothetical protein ACFYTQ_18105 [Nocardia sp. NPDC004068]|uniref:hypothetical protein n=1 Tax=Nocardia sp. NPDC004068 TaxID=3364303 RepID=UPI00367DF723
MQPSQDAGRVAAGLAYLCGHLADVRETLGEDGNEPLRRLLEVVRSGEAADVGPALDAVHSALRSAGDARGLYGNQRGIGPVGVRHLEVVYRCPLGRCTGRAAGEIDEDSPRCAVAGRELLRERLS